MPAPRVVHLLWGPTGSGPPARFAAAYRAHDAGVDHGLVLLFNGFADDDARARARAPFAGLGATELHLARPRLDLAAYALALRELAPGPVLFLNSYCEPLVGGWLARLVAVLASPGVGMVATTGSWESPASSVALPLRPVFRRRYAPFPNPHLRTGAFMLERDLARDLRWPVVRTKRAAWKLEAGREGLTRQVQARGLEAVVVGRDGVGYRSADWPASRTFRSGDQVNLLVADNRTRDFARLGPEGRRALAQRAWGRASGRALASSGR